jgi:hypothetical protein
LPSHRSSVLYGRPEIVKVAYLIRAHHAPTQLERLVDRLDSEHAGFFIHVSARTSATTLAKMHELVGDRANVTWVERVPTYYAGFSLVEATLSGLRPIAAADPVPEHTVILSGQDYPVRPVDEIEAFFDDNRGRSYVEHFALPAAGKWPGEHGGLDRIRYRYYERINYKTRTLRLPLLRRKFPAGLRPYGGGAWCALSADAVRFIVQYTRENPDVVSFFRHVKIPDEIYVPTVLMNSPLRETIVPDDVHYIDWSAGGARPKTLGTEDFDRIVASGKLFARKFDPRYDARILDLLDERRS